MNSNEALNYLNDIAHGRKMGYSPYTFVDIIRKDLEINEIIKRHSVDIFQIKLSLKHQIDDAFEAYNESVSYSRKLTKDEFTKVREWVKDEH